MTDPTPAEALKALKALREIDRITRLPGFDLGTLAWHMGGIQEITEAALAALPSPATDAGEMRTEEAGVEDEVAALRKALSNLTRACELADANEDLSELVDGSLLDAANAALDLQYPVIWTDEQVASLNAYQESRRRHPFTCGGNRSDDAHRQQAEEDGADMGVLIATKRGWICPVCDYRQFWAHDFMFAAIRGLAR